MTFPPVSMYQLKTALAGVGFLAGLLGMALERRWVVGVGVALLGVAFVLRFAERRRPAS